MYLVRVDILDRILYVLSVHSTILPRPNSTPPPPPQKHNHKPSHRRSSHHTPYENLHEREAVPAEFRLGPFHRLPILGGYALLMQRGSDDRPDEDSAAFEDIEEAEYEARLGWVRPYEIGTSGVNLSSRTHRSISLYPFRFKHLARKAK